MPSLKNKLTKKQTISLGVIIVMVGLLLISFNYINKKIEMAYDTMNIMLLESERPELTSGTEGVEEEKSTVEDTVQPETTNTPPSAPTSAPTKKTTSAKNYYIGTLEIPKISFKRGFTKKESSLNNVNKNIAVLSASDYPDKKNGNFILAGHSGNSSVAYFANLYKLDKGDTATVTYNNKKYTYKIVNIYLEPKVGRLAIYRDKSKDTLTLITCTKDDDEHQTVYIAEKIKEEKI